MQESARWIGGKFFSWPGTITGALLLYSTGIGSLYGDQYITAGLLILASVVWLTSRAILWDEVEAHQNRGYIRTGIALIAIFVLLFSCYLIAQRKESIDRQEVSVPSIQSPGLSPKDPHISAELALDSSKKDNTDLRILLENVGPKEISSLRSFMHTDVMADLTLIPGASTIAPHEKTELESGLFIGERPKEVNLYLLYEDASHETHYSEYSFLVPKSVAGMQPIAPVFSKEGNGDPLSTDRILKTSVMKGFNQPSGTIFFVFPERKPDGSPNQIFMYGGNKFVAVNSTTREAAVWRGATRIEKIAETAIGNKTVMHTIAVVWDDRKDTLGLNADGGPIVSAAPPSLKRR